MIGPDTENLLWSVWRQDDNGNLFVVRERVEERDALSLVRELEARGHKQTYWAQEDREGTNGPVAGPRDRH